ncbi:hypothetical protein K2Y00_03805 [Patescibacteria group bacterium]|nr:hypothetical protein [Patescibacteria group bacterium]
MSEPTFPTPKQPVPTEVPEEATSRVLQDVFTSYLFDLNDAGGSSSTATSAIFYRSKLPRVLARQMGAMSGLRAALHDPRVSRAKADSLPPAYFDNLDQIILFFTQAAHDEGLQDKLWAKMCAICELPPETKEIQFSQVFDTLRAKGYGQLKIDKRDGSNSSEET